MHLADLSPAHPQPLPAGDPLLVEQRRFGFTAEDLKLILLPMAVKGVEPTGSMGDDIPLAVLSRRPRLLYDYFRQLFAQVTNPPLDAIREKLVTSLSTPIGREHNLFAETPLHCRQLMLPQPILSPEALAAIRQSDHEDLKSVELSICWPVADGGAGLGEALASLCRYAVYQVEAGARLLILSDRQTPAGQAPIPALLATAALHHHLIKTGMRARCGLIVETGEAREIHHFCCLLGYGAGAVVPWLAFATLDDLARDDRLEGVDLQAARYRYVAAVGKGILKVLSKMGISTLQSYRGAQIFECVGLDRSVVDRWFTGTPSRIGGLDEDTLAREIAVRCGAADKRTDTPTDSLLDPGGRYKWRRKGRCINITRPRFRYCNRPCARTTLRRGENSAMPSST